MNLITIKVHGPFKNKEENIAWIFKSIQNVHEIEEESPGYFRVMYEQKKDED